MLKIMDVPTNVNLSETILNNARSNDSFNILVSRVLYDKYDTKALKNEVRKLFLKYQEMIYLNQFPLLYKGLSSYELLGNMKTKDFQKTTEDLALKSIEQDSWIKEFKDCLIKLSFKLTLDEATYLVGTFFQHQTEEILSERLNICRNTLRGIKKSCLLKTLLELKTMDERM